MARYIDLEAITAELDKIIREEEEILKEDPSSTIIYSIQAYQNTLSIIKTFEVKSDRLTILPEEKMKAYLKYLKGKKSSSLCDCGKVVEIERSPYYYDEQENDVYFASICPNCGELIITKE